MPDRDPGVRSVAVPRSRRPETPGRGSVTVRFLLLALLAGCPAVDEEPTPPPVFEVGPWQRGVGELDREVRGRTELRTITHVHSHWSHDACDGNPQPGGVPDEDCLQDLRDGFCENRIDVAFLSDHPGHADESDLVTLALLRGDDELLAYGQGGIANRMTCPSGHTVLMIPGIESGPMMPFGVQDFLPEHWGTGGPDAFEAMRDSGAAMWINHTEGRDVAELAELRPHGIEFYQLHANLAPDIREEDLGLDPLGYLGDVGPFFFPEANEILDPPHPDLAPIGFLVLNEPSHVALEVLGQTQTLGVSGGTDAHQNVFNLDAGDGERIDSYRRMLRWFHTRIRADEKTPDAALDALKRGQSWVAFEVFGTPDGFDFHASGDGVTEIGAEVPFSDALRLQVQPPSLAPASPRADVEPGIRTIVYRATPERTVVAEWEGSGAREIVPEGPGVYRVEVWITPRHLVPYLGELPEYAEREVPWILSGAVFVR